MNTKVIALCAGALVAASAANAGVSLFSTDINSMTLSTAGGAAFGGTTHTGVLTMSANALSTLNAVRFNGVPQPVAPGVTLAGITGSINLLNGFVQGGAFNITLSDGSAYGATIAGGAGRVNVQAVQGFRIDGLTFNGLFTLVGGAFGGVVLPFGPGPWAGSLLLSAYAPNANGTDPTTNFEVYADVPAPGAALGLGMGALALGARRRR